jgi:hypothetical protein
MPNKLRVNVLNHKTGKNQVGWKENSASAVVHIAGGQTLKSGEYTINQTF